MLKVEVAAGTFTLIGNYGLMAFAWIRSFDLPFMAFAWIRSFDLPSMAST